MADKRPGESYLYRISINLSLAYRQMKYNTSTKSLRKCDSVEPKMIKTEKKEKNVILALIILGLFCYQFLSLSLWLQ